MTDKLKVTEISPEEGEKVFGRGTNLLTTGKQALAGVTDAITVLPALAGLIGAAGETAVDFAWDDNDMSL